MADLISIMCRQTIGHNLGILSNFTSFGPTAVHVKHSNHPAMATLSVSRFSVSGFLQNGNTLQREKKKGEIYRMHSSLQHKALINAAVSKVSRPRAN